MKLVQRLFFFLAVLACAYAAPTLAQPYQYHVYLDTDLRSTTGCTVNGPGGQSFVGADYRLTTVVSGSPPVVTGRALANCTGGSFGPVAPQAISYPVGLNNGVPVPGGLADVIESQVSRANLPGVQPQVRVGFAAESVSGSVDVMFTANGAVGGPPMILGTPQIIPTLGFFGALLMAIALSLVALRTMRRNKMIAQMMLVCAFFSLGLAAWAANFIVDGQVGDWANTAPFGTDPVNDSVPPLTATDIVASFGADQSPNLFFRVDVVDAENQPPVAANDSYSTTEDQSLTVAAPGVLANDSDADGDPITAVLVTGPTRGTVTLNANGSFTYTPNANANGTDTFTYNANDGQANSSTPATVTITIAAVNDVPAFTVGPNQTVDEDAGAQTVNPWATAITDGDPEITQALTFNITNNTNAALFSVAPSVSPTGVLTYTPAANANGSATITLSLSDDGSNVAPNVNTSATQSFTITVTAVNDAPSFTAGPNQTVSEDAGAQTINPWATAISPGPADEAAQTVSFNVTANTNAALFSVAPSVSPTGVLTYTPAANANGVATITLTLSDNGSNVAPNVNTSAAQTFTITVNAINDVPSFLVGPDQTVNEDAGAQTVNPWATAITDGDPEITQALSFNITNNTNAALFSVAPSVSPTGVLTYTPAANANGTATITLSLSDDGSNVAPNVNTSATQTFTITVNAVNDAPSFTAGPAQVVNEDAGAQTVNPWAIAISPGPADESAQTVGFNVSNNNASLFSTAPSVSPTGVLTYTPAANANGVATVTVTLTDSGSNVAPNVNTSAPQTFTITVNAVNDAPVNAVPVAQSTGDSTPLVFSTANGNAISVADIDAAAGIVQMSFGTGAAANGTLTLANPGSVLTSLTGNGTEQVIATGTITALNLALNGPAGSLTYTPAVGTTAARTITIITNDQGNTGSGGAQIDTDTVSVNVDSAPTVSSSPAAGAIVANNVAISVNFSESVNVIAGITLTCGGPNLITGGSTGAAVTTLNLTYTAPLPAGACTLTVPASSVTDVDGIDPPNNPAATYTAVFTVDAAPAVTTTTPISGATTANNVALVVNFSEAIDATNAVTLTCGGSNLITGGASGTAVTVLNPTYAAPLPAGACTLTVVAANINDSDVADPPQNPVANTVVNFNVDAAPAFVSATPAAAATVGTGATVSFTFDEPVNGAAGAITLNCGGAIAGSLSGSGTATLTFTPSAALTAGASCTATAVAANISDVDSFDPPQNPIADVVRAFSVDSPPTVASTTPTAGAINVPLAGVVNFTFSEAVNAVVADFTYVCNSTPVAFTVSGSTTAVITLTPTGNLPINSPCTVTALTTITDSDLADPPNNLAAAFPLSFTSVNDSAPTVSSSIASGATTASGPTLSFTFSESVNIAANAAVISCAPSGATVSQPAGALSATTSLAITGSVATTGQPGDTCTVTINSLLVTDVDAIDPPDQLDGNASGDTVDGDADNFVSSYIVDSAPAVTSISPANGATNLATTTPIAVTFNEPVNATAGAITLNCGGAVAGTVGGSGSNTITFTPSANLPAGATCNLQVGAGATVTDVDAFDPPDQMVAAFTSSFTTDAPPSVVTLTPAEAAVVASTQSFQITFSEPVNASAGAFTLQCGATPIAFTAVPALPGSASVFTVTPTGAGMTAGANCVFTVVAAQIEDADGNDPPGPMLANFVRNVVVDAAPTVVSTTPINGAANAAPNTNISITFSEPVSFDTVANAANTSFDLECPTGSPVNFTVVTASPATTVVLDPGVNLPVNVVCSVTVLAAGIADSDLLDPPNNMAANFLFSFTPVNTPPVLTAGGTLSYTENQAPTVINNTITVSDSEQTTLASATVQITAGFQAGADVLACPGVCFGLTAGYSGSTLTLSGNASLLTYRDALRSVTYENTSDDPTTAPRTVTWIGNDGIDNSVPVTSTINVTQANDAPVVVAGSTLNYTEQQAATAIAPALTVTDPDSVNLVGATVGITAGYQTGSDILACASCGALTANFNAGTGQLTIGGTATVATYQAALRSVIFFNGSDAPSAAARTITFTANDGSATGTATSAVNLTAVNDAPTLGLPGTQSFNEDIVRVFSAGNSNLITVADVDAGGSNVQLAIAAASGTITLSGTAGLSFTVGDGTADASMTFTGTIAAINTALAGLSYTPAANFNGTTSLSFTLSDQGSTGTGGALTATGSISLVIAAVNDPPIAAAVSIEALAGIPVTYAAGTLSGTDPNDIEGGTTVTIDTTAGATALTNLVSATLNANGGFTIVPTPGVAGNAAASFQYRVIDNGTPGAGVSSTATATVTIDLNGPPTYFVRSTAVGVGNCNLGAECTLATAVTGIGVAGSRRIFISDANAHGTTAVPLNTDGWLIGQGVTGTNFATVMGYSAAISLLPGTATFPTLPSIGAAAPTVGGTVTLHNNSNVRGLRITTTGAAQALASTGRTGLLVNDLGTLQSQNATTVAISGSTGQFVFGDITATGTGAGFSFQTSSSPSPITLGSVTTSTGAAFTTASTGFTDFTAVTVTSTTGSAVDVSTSTGDYSFRTVNANGGGAGSRGIVVLNATGTFTVTGVGITSGSGGIIQAKQIGARFQGSNNITLANMNFPNNGTNQTVSGGDNACGGNLRTGSNLNCVSAIYAQNGSSLTLTNISVTDSLQQGINLNGISGLSITNSALIGNGDEAFENGLHAQNLTGTNTILNSVVRDNEARQIHLANILGSNTTLNITGTRTNNAYPAIDSSTTLIGRSALGADPEQQQGILMESFGAVAASMTLNLTGVVLPYNYPANAVDIQPLATSGTLGGTTTNSSFDTNAGGVIVSVQNGSGGSYNVTNSEFNRTALQSILLAAANPTTGTLLSTITGNTIGTAGGSGSACYPTTGANCRGVDVNFIGGTGRIAARIQNNTIQEFDGVGIAALGNDAGIIDLNIVSNTIQNPRAPGVADGIRTSMGTTAGSTMQGCLGISGNTISGTWQDPGVGTQFGIVTNVRFNAVHRLPGYGGAANNTAAVAAFLSGANTVANKVFAQLSNPGTYPGGAACATP